MNKTLAIHYINLELYSYGEVYTLATPAKKKKKTAMMKFVNNFNKASNIQYTDMKLESSRTSHISLDPNFKGKTALE